MENQFNQDINEQDLSAVNGGEKVWHPSDRDKPGYHIVALYYDKNGTFHKEYSGDYWTIEEGEADRLAVYNRLVSEGYVGINVYVGTYD